jgi:hypothetical protein
MNPNEIQHGGTHYKKAGNLQHWDSLLACGFGWEYYIGAATKYLTRIKDTVLDPSKAGHFIDKLIWAVENGYTTERFQTAQQFRINCDAAGRRVDVPQYLTDYFEANDIDPASLAAHAISTLMQATHLDDLKVARAIIAEMEKPAEGGALRLNSQETKTFHTGGFVKGEVTGLVGDGAMPTSTGYVDQDPGTSAEPLKTTDVPSSKRKR